MKRRRRQNPRLQVQLGKRIREHRMSLGWTQGTLGAKSGMDEKAIGRIEVGRLNVTVATLDAIAKALGVEIGDLFERSQRGGTGVSAELHRLVDDAPVKTRKVMLRVVRALTHDGED